MVADMISNKKLLIGNKLFIRERILSVSTVFITQSYFQVPKHVRLNCTHFLLLKFQTNKSFNKSHLIIRQILNLKTSWIFTKNVL